MVHRALSASVVKLSAMRRTQSLTLRRGTLGLLGALVVLATPVAAQDSDLALRVKRLESQVKALQRSVFPGAKGEFFEPEIQPAVPSAEPTGTPASSALADTQARLTALEGQVASLTDQTERATYSVGQVEKRLSALEERIATLEARAQGSATEAFGSSGGAPVAAEAPAAPTPAPPNAARAARIAAVELPKSADPADDRYVYGYRLWAANLYPEARTELAKVVSQYPKNRRASWAQNLLGRAYFDESQTTGNPELLKKAAEAFFDNYQTNPKGERASDSVYYLGRSLLALKEKARACDAFLTFDEVYGSTATLNLKALVAQGKKDAGC